MAGGGARKAVVQVWKRLNLSIYFWLILSPFSPEVNLVHVFKDIFFLKYQWYVNMLQKDNYSDKICETYVRGVPDVTRYLKQGNWVFWQSMLNCIHIKRSLHIFAYSYHRRIKCKFEFIVSTNLYIKYITIWCIHTLYILYSVYCIVYSALYTV